MSRKKLRCDYKPCNAVIPDMAKRWVEFVREDDGKRVEIRRTFCCREHLWMNRGAEVAADA